MTEQSSLHPKKSWQTYPDSVMTFLQVFSYLLPSRGCSYLPTDLLTAQKEERRGAMAEAHWIWNPAVPLAICVTLEKLLNCPVHWLKHYIMEFCHSIVIGLNMLANTQYLTRSGSYYYFMPKIAPGLSCVLSLWKMSNSERGLGKDPEGWLCAPC